MKPVTCCIRYKLAPGKLDEFEHYARTWQRIIERLDGTYSGCFLPGERPPDASHFSFPEVGRDGPVDVATVVFSFDDLDGYERYRRDASNDPECRRRDGPLSRDKMFYLIRAELCQINARRLALFVSNSVFLTQVPSAVLFSIFRYYLSQGLLAIDPAKYNCGDGRGRTDAGTDVSTAFRQPPFLQVHIPKAKRQTES